MTIHPRITALFLYEWELAQVRGGVQTIKNCPVKKILEKL